MKVTMIDDDGKFLGDIRIMQTNVRNQGEVADYTVLAYVDRGGGVSGLARRKIFGFPLKALNPLALLSAALKSLPPVTFGAEDDDDQPASTQAPVPTDLERRFNRAVSALPDGLRRLRDHGPAVRSEQPEQHGDDRRGESERS